MSPSSPRPPRPADSASSSSSLDSSSPRGSSSEPESAGNLLEPCHINRLPTEILIAVLNHLDALLGRPDSWDRHGHRTTFLGVARVSKRFKMVADPFVDRCIAVSPSNEVSTLRRVGRDGRSAPAQACRVFRLKDAEGSSAGPVLRVGEWAGRLPRVEELSLAFILRGSLSEAAAFSNLRHLDLQLCTFGSWPTTAAATFSRLTLLKLRHVTFTYAPSADSRSMRATFPSLRQLDIDSCECSDSDVGRLPLIPVEVVAQLDALLVRPTDIRLPSDSLLRPNDFDAGHAVLWQGSLDIPSSPPVRRNVAHVLIKMSSYDKNDLMSTTLDGRDRIFSQLFILIDHLPDLRLLLVPPLLGHHLERYAALVPPLLGHHLERYAALVPQRENIIKSECARRSIEVRTYDAARPLDGLVVPEFLEWRHEQAQAASGVVQG
ncbi:hypothetical protein JCM9279_004996 [Rhodotorula babjevae]